ncbi:MAG: GNAT family protein [Buchananella hordeovulneris]|nr:GNAT family protein [Buchananella hordeovulneris]
MEIRRVWGLPGLGGLPWPVELVEFDLVSRGLLRPAGLEWDDVPAGHCAQWPLGGAVGESSYVEGLVLPGEVLSLRPLRRADEAAWNRLRWCNQQWLEPWDPTVPPGQRLLRGGFQGWRRQLNAQARRGVNVCFGIELDGVLVGQMSIGAIQWGAALSTPLGYWVDQGVAGRGVVTLATAMAVDYLLLHCGLHRVEVNIRPENAASRRVAAKLGLRFEGVRERFLHINNEWADHESYAVTVEEVGAGLVARLEARAAPHGR